MAVNGLRENVQKQNTYPPFKQMFIPIYRGQGLRCGRGLRHALLKKKYNLKVGGWFSAIVILFYFFCNNLIT